MKQDLAFEALVANTGATIPAERGKVNAALKQIREAMPGVEDSELALEISHRSVLYRQVWPEVTISPTALSQNWDRVISESAKREIRKGTNLHGRDGCDTCGGDQMVLVGLRPAKVEGDRFEEYAPCPDCNPIEVKVFRHDGTVFRTPDPGRVRELMNG